MKCNHYHNVKEFYKDTFPIFLKDEVQNTLPLGNVVLGNNGGEPDGWRNTKNWFMATITDNLNNILLSAIMTPPFNITMYETDNIANVDAVNFLCDYLISKNISIPGITSENNLAERFAKIYTKKINMDYKIRTNMRIYKLEKVNENIALVGKLRRAKEKDLFFLPYWYDAFYNDCSLINQNFDDAVLAAKRAINKNMFYILEDDGMPVSIASCQREIVTGRCVNMVYTPPYFRKKGYASSCVAQVSQIVLDRNYKYVSLFTDLDNPISNSIYQKIGYKVVCDYNELEFIK